MEFGAEAVAKNFVLLGSVVANWKYQLRVIVPSAILEQTAADLWLAQMAVKLVHTAAVGQWVA